MCFPGVPGILRGVRLSHAFLGLAAVGSILALVSHSLAFKLAIPVCCLLGVATSRVLVPGVARGSQWVIGAFAFAALGDYFLSTRRGSTDRFVLGIAAYFVAHLGYIAYALANGRVHWITLLSAVGGFGTYFAWFLRPAIPNPVLLSAVLAYLLISCASLAAAAGYRRNGPARRAFLAGIGLIVFSDTLISLHEFLRQGSFNALILPTYYAALILIAFSVLAGTGPAAPAEPRPADPCSATDAPGS